MIPVQLTFDGREVQLADLPEPVSLIRRTPPRLTGAQAEIVRLMGDRGEIRSVDAGVIVHRHRRRACFPSGSRLGCCRYAATDGLEAMKRLERRGLARHTSRGRWTLP